VNIVIPLVIYTIDDDCLSAENYKGQRINVLFKHIQNLVTHLIPYFFNTTHSMIHMKVDLILFVVIRIVYDKTFQLVFLMLNAPDYDVPTQLLQVNERNTRFADVTVTNFENMN